MTKPDHRTGPDEALGASVPPMAGPPPAAGPGRPRPHAYFDRRIGAWLPLPVEGDDADLDAACARYLETRRVYRTADAQVRGSRAIDPTGRWEGVVAAWHDLVGEVHMDATFRLAGLMRYRGIRVLRRGKLLFLDVGHGYGTPTDDDDPRTLLAGDFTIVVLPARRAYRLARDPAPGASH